jgi:hypothetical protein
MLQKSSFLKEHLRAIAIVASLVVIGGAIYVCFFLDWVKYPIYEDAIDYCYSPNHEYYVVRRQSWWNSKFDQTYVRGTAKLYDKTGKLLYSDKTYLSLEAGPWWVDDAAGKRPSVVYQSTEKPGWGYDLPSSPGIDYSVGQNNRKCY